VNLDLSSLFFLPATPLLVVNDKSQTAASESYVESCIFFPGKQNRSVHMLSTLWTVTRDSWTFQKEKGYKDDIGPWQRI